MSIPWAILIWWLATGVGGIFNNASPLTGAPGAVLIYGVIALLVWPRREETAASGRSTAETSIIGPIAPKLLWSALWIGFALLVLETTNRAPNAIHDVIVNAETGQPSWIVAIDRNLAVPFAHHGTEASPPGPPPMSTPGSSSCFSPPATGPSAVQVGRAVRP